jgi:hypothetical protein
MAGCQDGGLPLFDADLNPHWNQLPAHLPRGMLDHLQHSNHGYLLSGLQIEPLALAAGRQGVRTD